MQEELFVVEEVAPGKGSAKRMRYPFWVPDEVPSSQDGLFGAEGVSVERFGSGASAKWDFLGYRVARAAVGVTATELNPAVVGLVAQYVREGGRVFVDSGAFGASRSGVALDFEAKVFPVYERLIEESGRPEGLLMVMPDKLGDQSGTLALQRKYLDRLVRWMDCGVEAVFPIQDGSADPVARYREIVEMIGGRGHVVGVPSNAHAWSMEETVRFAAEAKPARMHLLGLGKKDAVERLSLRIAQVSPNTAMSCDSCQIIAHVGHGRRLTDRSKTRLEAATEVVMNRREPEVQLPSLSMYMVDVLYEPDFLTEEQAVALGRALGYDGREWAEKFAQASHTGMLEVLGALDPDEEWIEDAVREIVRLDIYLPWLREQLSGPVRAYEVARMVLGDDPDWVNLRRRMEESGWPPSLQDKEETVLA